MLTLFEIYLERGSNPALLFTDEMRRETNVQLMTVAEARAVVEGLANWKPASTELDVHFAAVNARDARWVERSLEASRDVASFRKHEVG